MKGSDGFLDRSPVCLTRSPPLLLLLSCLLLPSLPHTAAGCAGGPAPLSLALPLSLSLPHHLTRSLALCPAVTFQLSKVWFNFLSLRGGRKGSEATESHSLVILRDLIRGTIRELTFLKGLSPFLLLFPFLGRSDSRRTIHVSVLFSRQSLSQLPWRDGRTDGRRRRRRRGGV